MCAWSNLLQCNYKLKCIRNRLSAAADFYSFRVLACLSRDGVCPSHKDGMLCHNVMMLSPPADETPVQVYSGVGRACCQSRETNFHFLDRPRLRLLKKFLEIRLSRIFVCTHVTAPSVDWSAYCWLGQGVLGWVQCLPIDVYPSCIEPSRIALVTSYYHIHPHRLAYRPSERLCVLRSCIDECSAHVYSIG